MQTTEVARVAHHADGSVEVLSGGHCAVGVLGDMADVVSGAPGAARVAGDWSRREFVAVVSESTREDGSRGLFVSTEPVEAGLAGVAALLPGLRRAGL